MDSTKLMSLLDQLDDEMDDLEESLVPLIKTTLSETSSKLPLLDKAKLYVLVTYAIESMLFSYLRLNGVKAREHPVFVELTRVKQYFDKIKAAETPAQDRTLVPDKQAVARFIKAGLAGNDKYDLEKAEREAKERARAHIKFEEVSKGASNAATVAQPEEQPEESDSESSAESSAEAEEPALESAAPPKKKSGKHGRSSTSSSGLSENASKSKASPKADKKAAKKAKREKKKAKLQTKRNKNKPLNT
ncbi:hypothetical protein EG329_001857 [Mollisiaceae sp. DMI_Dod_QoI]|nr:hypothetical protein EG329_001857 [Helotiales sp. DMI_Dod_QoI]